MTTRTPNVVRSRTLLANVAGIDNMVEVSRPTLLDPYNDPDIDAQGVQGFEVAFRNWEPLDVSAPFVPADRGMCWLYEPGLWRVRCKLTDPSSSIDPARLYFREIAVESWEQVRQLTSPAKPQIMVGQSRPITTTGQQYVATCGESIPAVRVEVMIDPTLALVTGMWIGCGGQKGLPSVSTWLPKGTFAAPQVAVFEGTRLPIGSLRSRSVGGNGNCFVTIWSKFS